MKNLFTKLKSITFFSTILIYNYIFIFIFIFTINIYNISKMNLNFITIFLLIILFIPLFLNLFNGIKSFKLNFKTSFISGPWIYFLNLAFLQKNNISEDYYLYYFIILILVIKSTIASLNFKFHIKAYEISKHFNLDNYSYCLISKYYGTIYYTFYKNGIYYHLSEEGEGKKFNTVQYKDKSFSYQKIYNYLNQNNKSINDLNSEEFKLLEIYDY